MLGFLVWNPSPEIFTLPLLNLPLTWYGLLFATGFFLGFHLFTYLAKKELSKAYCESLLIYIMIGTVAGARLGHLLFYEPWSLFVTDPLIVFRTWEGGLASHGGVLGVIIALALFYLRHGKTHPKFTFLRLLDLLSIPTIMVGCFIRIGNFFNQEIYGIVCDYPWAVLFVNPADGALPLPRHPVQLYEAAFYLFTFLTSLLLWRWKVRGIAGYCITMAFTFRFFIEALKDEMSYHLLQGDHLLLMGQYLSIPMIIIGLALFFLPRTKLVYQQ